MRDALGIRVRSTIVTCTMVALPILAACSNSTDSTNTANQCLSTVNSADATSPSANQLVVPGVLYSNESLTIGYTLLGHATTTSGIAPGNPSSSITFTGLPSGAQTFTFQITCTGPAPTYSALHSDFPSAVVTIK